MNRFSVLTGIPEFTKGFVRELRVRWMLEEMGLQYEEIRYPHPEIKKEEYLQKQPFGQVPYFESDGLYMFESGAILLHLALKHNKLLPIDENDRAQALTWIFAAQSSLEPYFTHHFFLKNDPDATDAMKNKATKMIKEKLQAVSKVLGEKEFFCENFTIADIVMSSVLKIAQSQELLGDNKNLSNYLLRNESRPAFKRALNDHLKLYESK